MNTWVDISVPLTSGMVHWPGDPVPNFEQISDLDTGGGANVTLCRMTAHTGTHMDAPRHFISEGKGIDSFPIDYAIGRARVIAAPNAEVVTRKELEGRGIEKGDRILIKTRNSEKDWTRLDFDESYVGIDSSAAQFLVDAGVVLVGVDYLSVGMFHGDGAETHRILLGNSVWILEGLALGAVSEGVYDLICLPLRIAGCDGSPARAVLRKAS